MNRLRVKAQIFFLCRNVYSGSFYHFHRQMISNSIQFDRYGLKSFELWGKLVRCSVGKHVTKERKQLFKQNFGLEGTLRQIYTEPHCRISPLFVFSCKIKQK